MNHEIELPLRRRTEYDVQKEMATIRGFPPDGIHTRSYTLGAFVDTNPTDKPITRTVNKNGLSAAHA